MQLAATRETETGKTEAKQRKRAIGLDLEHALGQRAGAFRSEPAIDNQDAHEPTKSLGDNNLRAELIPARFRRESVNSCDSLMYSDGSRRPI